MGKTVKLIIGVALTVAVAIAAPYLAPLALAAIGTATATALALAVTTAVIGAALGIGAMLLMKAMGLTAGAPKSPIGPPTVFRQSITDSFIVYGERRVGGLLAFFHARKSGSDHYRYFVIAVAGHRCQGVTDWMLGDEVVTVDGSNMVTSGPYAGAAWLWFQRGLASETANATFVSECDGNWTTDHKGSGIAAIYAKFKMTDAVVQAGMPNIGAAIEGCDEIYDPRDASTGYSNNAALVFYHWMALPREEGGFGAYDDEIPDDDWISAQANVSDEEVEGEARYALDGVITTGAPPSEIRDVMAVNCAGTITYSGGKHLMRVGYWVPATSTLTEDELAGPITVQPFLTGDEAATEVQGSYVNPGDGYQAAPFPTQTTGAADIRQMSLDLAFVTSPYRAQRIARIMMLRANCEKRVTWPMTIAGLAVKALDMVILDTERYGLSNYAWQVGGWSFSADFGVVLTLREENEDIYADLEPATVDAAPAVAVAEPVLISTDVQTIIRSTYPVGLILTASDAGASASIVVGDHVHDYPGSLADVSVTGGTIAGLAFATLYYPYADLDDIGDTTPNYGAATDYGDALNSAAHPYRMFLNQTITTPADGGGDTGGGGAGGGYGGGGQIP